MNLILFIGDSYHHKFLAQRIMEEFNVVKIIIDQKKTIKKPRSIIKKIISLYLDLNWKNLMKDFGEKVKKFDSEIIIKYDNINELSSNEISHFKFDYVVVSGTSLLKKELIKTIGPKKILNLHTGLSPYINGGPNCTNWCISINRLSLIGNTIMWLDEGIDSGNIIYSKQVSVNTKKGSFSAIHKTVLNDAHEMYLDVLRKLKKENHLESTPQNSIAVYKRTFKTNDWTINKILKLYWNLIFRNLQNKGKEDIKTVSL